ncbi:unnamed protein product [Rhizoctonia solani]|uniref:Zn(2)-C6 fungal-type domain-containing protein n=1 Tax=Rhizoctonia solani TaxID=456999 RepID=A0A8H2XEA6_9AGAM|nr:unnamed protein product [Rhizoctonia solani]
MDSHDSRRPTDAECGCPIHLGYALEILQMPRIDHQLQREQMIPTKSKPGPRRTSCLTCRKRRKKCDLARPSCVRCLESGHECLGYDSEHNELRRNTQGESANGPFSRLHPINIPATILASSTSSEPGYSDSSSHAPGDSPDFLAPENYQYISRTGARYGASPISESTIIHNTPGPTSCANSIRTPMLLEGDSDCSCSWQQDQSQLTPSRNSQVYQPGVSYTLLDRNRSHHIIQALCTSFPASVDATQIMREAHFAQIIHEYHLQRAKHWFALPPSWVRECLLEGPKPIIWAMYLGAKLFQALNEDNRGAMVLSLVWIDKLEGNFGNSCGKSSLSGAMDWLLTQLELVFLKFTTIGCRSGYLVLRKTLPVFLSLVAVDPNLHVEYSSANLVISFPRALGAHRVELKWFVMYDTIASLLLGVLPLVEYGYDGQCDPASHEIEWIHGIPVPLIEIISQVNSWRAGSRVAPLDDWRNLERCVLAWQPQLAVAKDEEFSAQIAARLAIQEGWRHVALIYIYMGMCGVSSHDTRVQEAIKQIIRLGEAVDNLPIGVHIFVHCVIVGLGARLEKHRSIVRKKLLSFKGARVWLFCGPEFSRVLEHLWYGVGAGGAAVTWDDYIRSRDAVAPI